tara:strand:+ start:459 stop:587 length:129 start_codon:yes stop_codon:yes gene_type:complete
MQELWKKLDMPQEGKEAFDKIDDKFKQVLAAKSAVKDKKSKK